VKEFSEKNALEELQAMEGLGFEYFWMDAYCTRGNFPGGIGNYALPAEGTLPDPARFPRGLLPFRAEVRRAGLRFLLWFEPERVAPETLIDTRHPEYVIPDPTTGEPSLQNLYDLGNPRARRYMTEFLVGAIREYGIDCLRIDFNLDPLPHWQALNAKEPDRVGIAEIRYVEGLYRMWDDILAAFPDLFIDNCASGGRRIELETCRRSVPLWRTDANTAPALKLDANQNSLQNQAMTAGLNRFIPWSTGGQIVERLYDFRSGWNGGIVVWDIPTPRSRDLLRRAIAEGNRIRRYWLGDFYPLAGASLDPAVWCLMQYHLPREEAGLVVAFRRHVCPEAACVAALRCIVSDARYEVSWSIDTGPSAPRQMRGEELRQARFAVDECPGSLLLEYRRLP
jgi:alpha-galactosidase